MGSPSKRPFNNPAFRSDFSLIRLDSFRYIAFSSRAAHMRNKCPPISHVAAHTLNRRVIPQLYHRRPRHQLYREYLQRGRLWQEGAPFGKSWGSCRHWQLVFSIYSTVSTSLRLECFVKWAPRFSPLNSGCIMRHCAVVKSLGYFMSLHLNILSAL